MEPRSGNAPLRVALGIVLVLAALNQGRHTFDAVSIVLDPGQPREPLFFRERVPAVASVHPEAHSAGIRAGDRILSVNGAPVTGAGIFKRAVMSSQAGSGLILEVLPSTGGPRRRVAVPLAPRGKSRNPWLLLFQAAIPIFSQVLGFWVAFLRPRDVRSWILLGLMLSFAPLFTLSSAVYWSGFMLWLAIVFRYVLQGTWGFWMILLGLRFPERLDANRWLHRLPWILGVPLWAKACLGGLVQYAWLENAGLMESLYPIFRLTASPGRYLDMASIGLFFALIGMAYGKAHTLDARRRALMLNIGAQVSFTPMFLLVLRSLFMGRELFDAPWGVTGFAILMMALFPITLAYIVVVYRALDVRVVLRLGLQYALARRSVMAVQSFLSIGVLLYALEAAGPGVDPLTRYAALAAALAFVALLFPVARMTRTWTDRRFFRAAYNAEQILSDLAEQVRSIVETRPLLETVARRISESLYVPRIAMLLKENGVFRPAFTLGYGETPDAAFPESAKVAEWLRHGLEPQVLYLDDPASWVYREVRDSQELHGLKALDTQLLLPLSTNQGLVGFASLGPKRSEEPYSPTDLRLLRSLALQTGLAIENSRLTAAVAEEIAQREQLHREMTFAREVQQRLFPQRSPIVPGALFAGACRPAQSVGGDYYDFVDLPGGKAGLAVGDVSGKGMPAALLMAALQASVRGQAMNGVRDLAVFLGNVNKLIYDMSPKSHFATLFYAEYDPATRMVRYASGGHNPPILLQSENKLQLLTPTGPGIGLSRRGRYEHAGVALQPGDVLIAYTDGFTEAMNAAREEYGEARLIDAARQHASLEPPQIIASLMSEVDRFVAGAEQQDDMTMVVLKIPSV
jgi:sigma-B regulation protein RsbU (phosphoserine phosphatase)